MGAVAAVPADDVCETGRSFLVLIMVRLDPDLVSLGRDDDGDAFLLASVLRNIFDSTPASLFLLIVCSNRARAERMLAFLDMVDGNVAVFLGSMVDTVGTSLGVSLH